ncbi:MAG: hypothetical protein M3Y24_04380 [Acidobacteriota bacterium]|nr:hypothetical protein [Acidobacteriota bacterium]
MAAFEMALSHLSVKPGMVHHSDRGVQYAADDYTSLLDEHGELHSCIARVRFASRHLFCNPTAKGLSTANSSLNSLCHVRDNPTATPAGKRSSDLHCSVG